MADRLQKNKPPWYFTKPPMQLKVLPYARRKMSTNQSAVMLRGWGVKAGWFIALVDKRVSGRQNCVIPR